MTVVWNFATTQVMPTGLTVRPTPLPSLTGTLTLSDAIWSSGGLDYAYTGPAWIVNPGHPIPALDWALSFDGYDDLSFPQSSIDFGGTVHLSFAGGTLSGRITQDGYFNSLDMSIGANIATGSWARDTWSDCCAFVGTWTDPPADLPAAAVPEPGMALPLMLAAVVAVICRRIASVGGRR